MYACGRRGKIISGTVKTRITIMQCCVQSCVKNVNFVIFVDWLTQPVMWACCGLCGVTQLGDIVYMVCRWQWTLTASLTVNFILFLMPRGVGRVASVTQLGDIVYMVCDWQWTFTASLTVHFFFFQHLTLLYNNFLYHLLS